ncbi:MAG: transporter substrate-binding domain-containing protein [Burkholderiales bacterium]|nr:transporter substrate-binding domain-containing protein [Burkholderiales bacterium]
MIPRGWYLQQNLEGMGFTNIHSVSKPVDAVRMLTAGRAPVMALDDVTLADTLNEAKIDAREIVAGMAISQVVQYIAFWREAPDELINSWQKALDEMKADGSFIRIYNRWLPGVTPP